MVEAPHVRQALSAPGKGWRMGVPEHNLERTNMWPSVVVVPPALGFVAMAPRPGLTAATPASLPAAPPLTRVVVAPPRLHIRTTIALGLQGWRTMRGSGGTVREGLSPSGRGNGARRPARGAREGLLARNGGAQCTNTVHYGRRGIRGHR